MQRSNVKSEQILKSGNINNDYGEILTHDELKIVILKYFIGSYEEDGHIYGFFNDKKYCILYKNVSYLGIPHPIHKKRIQIPNSYNDLYNKNRILNIDTLLIGVYSYKTNIILVDFSLKKRGKNSSAHVYANDIRNATINGYFKKTDMMNNIVILFNPKDRLILEAYLEEKLYNEDNFQLPFITYIDEYFDEIDKELFGIECYKEMANDSYCNTKQAEWPGFYMEYRLEKYINKFHINDVIQFLHNKSKGQIDLDLYFPQIKCYGDLKTHSNNSNEIIGNDYSTIEKVISKNKLYYIICNHDTIRDKDRGYIVTKFWNKLLNKKNTLSYGNRMKYAIQITNYQVLDINKYNKKYLKKFNQGVNSNNKKREPKISIAKNDINNFLVYNKSYDN